MTIAIDDVCTETQLSDYMGGLLARTLPRTWANAEKARQWALDEVMRSLVRRRPPIREGDLADVTELRTAVLYGAAAHLYEQAMTSGGEADLWFAKYQIERKKFRDECESVQPTSSEGAVLLPGGTRLSRA